jgi:hypothetical protein
MPSPNSLFEPVQEAEQAHADETKDDARVAVLDPKCLRGELQLRS